MLKTNVQTFEIDQGKKAGKQKQRDNQKHATSPFVICLLMTIIVLLICVLASIVVMSIQFEIASNSEDTQNMKSMARDMQIFMPQIKSVVPQISTVVEGNDFNFTKLMHRLNDFDVLAEDFKKFMPQIKTAMPTITALVGSDDFNVTKLVRQLNDFETLGEDMHDLTPKIKDAIDSLGDTDVTKMTDKLKDFSGLIDKIQTDPLSLLIDGAVEANTNMSRWRAVALEAGNILQKLSKVDYSVSVMKPKYDSVQFCEGKKDPGFEGDDKKIYETDNKNSCESFNVDPSLLSKGFAKGFGTCKWEDNDCKPKEDDDERSSYRWIRHAGSSSPEEILPKSFSDDMQTRFAHYQKFASDFAGTQVPKLKPVAAIDLPLYLSNLMGMVQPGLLLNVLDATNFLEKQSLSQAFCEPGGKERHNSCEWVDEGYEFAVDNGFKLGLRVTRAIAQNLHKVWVA